MNKLIALILLTLIAAPLALAQEAPVIETTSSLYRIQTDPADGIVEAFFDNAIIVAGVTYTQPKERVAWPIGSAETIAITLVDGTTATTTRAALMAAIVAIAQEEKAKGDSPESEEVIESTDP
jgi:hypothetical protein